jgi:hypothetical protein
VSRETYISSGAIREEYAVADLHSGTITFFTTAINSSALEVACPPARTYRHFRKNLRAKIMKHTCVASFEIKLEVWISTMVPTRATIAPPYKLHAPAGNSSENFRLFFFSENAQMELKGSANEC